MNTIKFYLENDNHEEFNFNEEMLTFPLQVTKVQTIKRAFKKMKVILFALQVGTDLLKKEFMAT